MNKVAARHPPTTLRTPMCSRQGQMQEHLAPSMQVEEHLAPSMHVEEHLASSMQVEEHLAPSMQVGGAPCTQHAGGGAASSLCPYDWGHEAEGAGRPSIRLGRAALPAAPGCRGTPFQGRCAQSRESTVRAMLFRGLAAHACSPPLCTRHSQGTREESRPQQREQSRCGLAQGYLGPRGKCPKETSAPKRQVPPKRQQSPELGSLPRLRSCPYWGAPPGRKPSRIIPDGEDAGGVAERRLLERWRPRSPPVSESQGSMSLSSPYPQQLAHSQPRVLSLCHASQQAKRGLARRVEVPGAHPCEHMAGAQQAASGGERQASRWAAASTRAPPWRLAARWH